MTAVYAVVFTEKSLNAPPTPAPNLAEVTAPSTILAVVTVLSDGVPMSVTDIAATIISIAAPLEGASLKVTTAGVAALTAYVALFW